MANILTDFYFSKTYEGVLLGVHKIYVNIKHMTIKTFHEDIFWFWISENIGKTNILTDFYFLKSYEGVLLGVHSTFYSFKKEQCWAENYP